MERAKMFFQKLLHPSKWVLIFVPPLSFAALIFIFATQTTRSVSAYMIYCMSAYSLTIWLAALPQLIKKMKTTIMTSRIMRKVGSSKITERYLNDLAFRGSVSIYQGVAVVPAEYSDGRNDRADGADKLWIFLSRLYHLSVSTLHILYNDNINFETCKVPQVGQPHSICCEGTEFHRRHDVDSRFADSDDLPFF